MSGEKTTQSTNSNQTQTATATPEQTALNQLQLKQAQDFAPTQELLNQNAGNFINSLFTGNIAGLGSIFGQVANGTSGQALDDSIAQGLRDVNGQLAKSGAGTMMESGASQAAGVRAAAGMRQDAKQFDIGSFLNLANLAVGGQAQIQQPINSSNAQLGSRLAGLNSYNSTGTSNQTTIGMNPFLKSFEQSAGKTFGSPFMQNSSGTMGFGSGFGA